MKVMKPSLARVVSVVSMQFPFNEDIDALFYERVLLQSIPVPLDRVDAGAKTLTMCFAESWRPVIAGLLVHLSRYNFEIDDDSVQAYELEQDLGKLMSFIDLCQKIEECLLASQTIADLQTAAAAASAAAAAAQADIDAAIEAGNDGNFYNDNDVVPQTDLACQVSGYMVEQISDFIVDFGNALTTSVTLLDFIVALFTLRVNYAQDILNDLIAQWFGNPPIVFDALNQAEKDLFREWLYCNGFDKFAFTEYLNTLGSDAPTYASLLESLTLVAWERWIAEGQFASGYDCAGFCAAPPTGCVEYDFTVSNQGWALQPDKPHGQYFAGLGWRPVSVGGVMQMWPALINQSEFFNVTRFEVDYVAFGGTSGRYSRMQVYTNSSASNEITFPQYINDGVERTMSIDVTWNNYNGFRFYAFTFGTEQVSLTIKRIRVYYDVLSGTPDGGTAC